MDNMDDRVDNNEKLQNPGLNLVNLYDSIYVKFKNRQNESTVIEGRRVEMAITSWGRRRCLGRAQGNILHAGNVRLLLVEDESKSGQLTGLIQEAQPPPSNFVNSMTHKDL